MSLLTAARVILYINGTAYSYVTDFRWSSATPSRQIRGLDSSMPYELGPGIASCQGSIGLLRGSGTGGLEGIGISPSFEQLVKGRYFTLMLVDRLTDTTLFRADNCWMTNQSWNAPSKSRVTGQMTFEALSWSNEARA